MARTMEHIRLTDATLMEYAETNSPQLMRYVAVRYLGVPMTSIEIWQEKWRENIVMINYECLAYWRCRNPGPGAKNKLDKILARASQKRTVSTLSKYATFVGLLAVIIRIRICIIMTG